MNEWETIWDHEIAYFGKRSIDFVSEDCAYRIDVDDRNQDEICVTFADKSFSWHIFTKAARQDVFRLAGMTLGKGDPHGDDVHWFELTLTKPAVLRYFGDRVLVHEDYEA